jgi:hypothetical protein
MAGKGHTIETLTFDIQISQEKDYQQVADVISSITEVELPLFLQELLDTYQIEDQTIQIEKIELDLGDISLMQSRSQLISQFKNSLQHWFKETFSSETLEKSSEIKTYSLQERDFTLLKYFITYGKIPWWGLNPPFIPDESLKKYIREASVKTKNLVFEVGQEKSTRKRIIYQFKEDTLYQLFGILSPRPSSFFKQYATELTYIHQKQKIVEEEDLAFKKVLQELILTYLISHKATSIDQTAFFRKQLLMLSRQYSIDYRTILDRINDIIEKLPEHFTSQSTIKQIVKKLLKQDFEPLSIPQNISTYSFTDYAEILETFYQSKPEQISGKYKSKRERDRFIRQMLRQNKQKTILLLKKIHRKFQLNKEQTALLFSENVLLDLLTIGSTISVETIHALIEPLKKVQDKFFVFSSSPLSIKSIVYTQFLFQTFTESHSSEEVTLQVLKNIAKIYSLPLKKLIPYIPAFSSDKLSKINYDGQQNNAVKNLNKSELKKILFGLLKNNLPLFEEFLKKVRIVHPTLGSYIQSEAFYIFAIQLLSEKSTSSTQFHHFINEIAPVLSKNIPLNTLDFQKSLLIAKDSLSSKLKNQLVKSLKGNTDLSTPGLKQLGTLSKPLDNLNIDALRNILHGLLKNNLPLFEEFLKKVRLVHPTLGSYIQSEAFYIFTIQLLSEKSTSSTEFHHFINEIAPVLSKNIPVNTLDFQKSLLIAKDSISSKLRNQLVKSLKGNTDLSTPGLKQLGTLSKPLDNLNIDALRNILHGLLKNNLPLFEEFLKKVRLVHPTLGSYIQSEAFYIFAIQLFLINPSDVNKTDKWLLKFILKLSQKAKIPVKTFLYPLLGKDILIPGRLIKELRQIYAFILEKSPTYSDTVDPIFKSNESMEKLILILGESLFEDESFSPDIDKGSLFLEILWLKENDILSKIIENRYNPLLPVLLVTGLPEEALQFLQMKMAGETYPVFIEGIQKINKWIQQYNIIRLPKNKLNLWLKQNSMLFLIQFGKKPWKIEDYYYFILEKLQKERLLQWKELEQTIQHIPKNLQSEILYFISDTNQLPTPTSWRDQQFFTDLIVHYITTGVIQPWLNKPYLELNELIYLFSDALKSENAHFIKAILSISLNQARLKRIFQLLDKTDPFDFIRVIDNLQPQKSIVAFYESLTVLSKKFISSSNIEMVIIELFLEKKIWNISSEMIRYEIMIDNLQLIYNVKIDSERINIKEKPFHLEWLSYYLETGMWPRGFNESTKEAYYQFIHNTLTERPDVIIKITESIPYYSFQQTIFREIFTLKEIGLLLNTLMKLKNIDSIFLTTLINKYLIQSNTFILESNLYILVDVLLSSLLFKVPKGRKTEALIQEALEGILPEVKEKDKKIKAISNITLWENDLELIDYYLNYGSIPIESIRMVPIDWEIMIARIIKNYPRALLFKLHFWSKSPKKINRLFDLLKIETILSIVSLIHPELADHFFLLEKSIEAVSGEKISLKLGFKNDTDTLKGILFIWSKMSKLQPDTTPITFKLFSMYVEKKKIQPGVLLSLVIEKVKNVSSKQIQIIKEIQKFAKDSLVEKPIKKEIPPIPEGLPPESIYIANAGLILLWPFLGRYFRRLNLVGAKEFNDEASRMRAILLIQYLVTGKKEAPEYELALNKLLCGANMDMEVDMEIDITEEEINLSNSLLTGAITNWEKLKGTRIGTFRETFLQRNGSLYYMNNRWELKVEKKAYDVLLETLPWGIQMIQMSWMKERLVVLWR